MSSKKVKEQLLSWSSDKVVAYGLKIVNLTSSWKSGLAFCAILHYHDNNCIDYHSLSADEPERNLELAFKVAHKRFGIYPLLDVEDLTCDRPDWKSIFTYVSEIRRALQNKGAGSAISEPKSKKHAKEIPHDKRTETELKKAMGQAMERVRKQNKMGELIRANKEGRKLEYLFPYLKKKGWTLQILKDMGVDISSDSLSEKTSKPQKQAEKTHEPNRINPPPQKSLPPAPIKVQADKSQKYLVSSRSAMSAGTFSPSLLNLPSLTSSSLEPPNIEAPKGRLNLIQSSQSTAGFPASEPVQKENSLKGQIQFGGAWYAADLVLLSSGYYKATVTESVAAIQQNLVNLTITVPEDRVYVETVLKKALTRVASSLYELTDSASGYFQLWE